MFDEMTDSDPLLGTTIDGRFELDRLLGSGGMGKVYRGEQLSVKRSVAVKVLRSDLSEIPSLQQRFFREAQVLASLDHPNIVGLVDFGHDKGIGALYMAMQFIDGRSLTDLVNGGRLPLGVSLNIARQICSGLAEAHAAGVIHRDLKPDNVMLQTTAEGSIVAKILDFGIALPTGKVETRLTATGGIIGTPHYMSPEQAQDMSVGPQSDLYSVGVILYEMIAGSVPFTGDTPLAVLFKTVNQEHPPIGELLDNEQIRGPLAKLIDSLLSKNPAGRPSSAAEVAAQLDELQRGVEMPVVKSVETLDTLVQPALVSSTATPAPEPAAMRRPNQAEVETNPVVPKKRSSWPVFLVIGGLVFAAVAVVAIAAAMVVFMFVRQPQAPAAAPEAVAQVPTEETPEPAPAAVAPPSETPPKPAPSAKANPTPKPPKAKPVAKPAAKPAPEWKDPVACQNRDCNVTLRGKDAHYACQGATCTVECEAGGCGQVCQAGSTCTFKCAGGGCRQTCFAGTTCELSCAGGNCEKTVFE